jgi:soluble lytic murein transglycosylase-like protein
MTLYANEDLYDDQLAAASSATGVPVALMKAIIGVESGFNPNATNLTGRDMTRGGSYGLFQVSLETAQGYGFTGEGTGLLDPATNITIGSKFLADVYAQAGDDPETAAALYNGGKALGGGAFSNQSYVNSVMQNYDVYAGVVSPSPTNSEGVLYALAAATAVWAGGRWAGWW